MTDALSTDSNFADPDAAFRTLVEAHRGLSVEESASLNARLVLLLANHIGEHLVLEEAVKVAKSKKGMSFPTPEG